MDVTFMIGNGFDLACGLYTKFKHVYDKYCETDSLNEDGSENENIKKFKMEILKDKINEYKNWADFEMAIPEFAKKSNSFEEFEEFILDFIGYLDGYLQEEEKRIEVGANNNKLTNDMKKYLYHINDYCLQKSKEGLRQMMNTVNEHCFCKFITFNYTNTLELVLSELPDRSPKGNNTRFTYQHSKPLHIHSTLGNGIILGLDNEKLFEDIFPNQKQKVKNLIDKLNINDRYGTRKPQAINILEQSRVIVILGWSMGDSDSFWVGKIRDLFSKKKDINLIYVPYYSEVINPIQANQQLNREDEQKDLIAAIFNISEEEKDRLHIVTVSNYMELSYLAKANEEEQQKPVAKMNKLDYNIEYKAGASISS